MPKPTGKNKENWERTRAHLMSVATACFAEHGFAETSTTMIIKAANSSRGSLYHHFPDKKALFQAVYDQQCQVISDRVGGYPYEGIDPPKELVKGCLEYLRFFKDPAFARIILMDAPNVLGMEYCRSRDAETAYKELYDGIHDFTPDAERAMLTTDFLSGAMDFYAERIAISSNPNEAYETYAAAFEEFANKVFQ